MIIKQRIVNNFNNRLRIFLPAAALFICTAATVVIINANYTGEWNLNTEKSDLGEYGGRFAPKKIKVDGQAESIAIERFTTNQNGEEVTTKEKLSFDGKESETTVFGGSKKKSSAKWSADGQSLNVNSVILFDRNGEITEIKVTEIWKITESGSLSVESTSNSSFGMNTMKLVYDKAK